MNKEEFLKDFKKEKSNKSQENKKTNIKFINPFKKKKDKTAKKKSIWTKILINILLVFTLLLSIFSIFAVNGFNMIADKDYLNRVEEIQNLSEKSNGVGNSSFDYQFIQFFSKNSNTIMLFSLIILIVVTLLVFTLNLTIFKKKKGEQ